MSMSARKRLAGVLIFLGLMMFSLMVGAWGPVTENTGQGNQIIWNPTGTIGCASSAHWRLRVYTYDFGPLDSTGTSRFIITVNGVDRSLYRTGEHDGYTWNWNTPYESLTYASVTFYGLSSGGLGSFSVNCVAD